MKEDIKTAVTQWLSRHQGERAVTEIPRELEELLWQNLVQMQLQPFSTLKGLEFTYRIKGHEIFVDRKDKSITRATVRLSFQKALELQARGQQIKGPKMLGTFGASYLYPVFLSMGVIQQESRQLELKDFFADKFETEFDKIVDG